MAQSDDLGVETRWPEFAAAAAAHGYRSVPATTLVPDVRALRLSGALNVYAREHGSLRGRSSALDADPV